ncbi:MAG: hypothetical protein KJ648_07495 [Candidatus Omnitrophica bacterium]|nr:hypothetical protein [Candidatus Omnitrophota bacterium]
MSIPIKGEIRPVAGRLALVLAHDPVLRATKIQDHGQPASDLKGWRWFHDSQVGEPVGEAEVLAERRTNLERGMACSSPDCWCRKFDWRPL